MDADGKSRKLGKRRWQDLTRALQGVRGLAVHPAGRVRPRGRSTSSRSRTCSSPTRRRWPPRRRSSRPRTRRTAPTRPALVSSDKKGLVVKGTHRKSGLAREHKMPKDLFETDGLLAAGRGARQARRPSSASLPSWCSLWARRRPRRRLVRRAPPRGPRARPRGGPAAALQGTGRDEPRPAPRDDDGPGQQDASAGRDRRSGRAQHRADVLGPDGGQGRAPQGLHRDATPAT